VNSGVVVDTNWHQVVVTYNGSVLAIAIDGSLKATLSIPIDTGLSPLTVGALMGGQLMLFRGAIDNVRVYNRALSAQEISQLYQYELGPTFSLNLTMFVQNTNKHSGVITTTAAPRVLTYTAASLLKLLAVDENLKGRWPSNSFPQGASLVMAGNGFVVVSGDHTLLDVSDLLSLSLGVTDIASGAHNDATGLASHSEKQLAIIRITFDDTSVIGGANFKFYLQGLLTQTVTDTTPVSGVYLESRTMKLTNGAGEGWLQNVPLVCTGTAASSLQALRSL
jgi:hypothetical protein